MRKFLSNTITIGQLFAGVAVISGGLFALLIVVITWSKDVDVRLTALEVAQKSNTSMMQSYHQESSDNRESVQIKLDNITEIMNNIAVKLEDKEDRK